MHRHFLLPNGQNFVVFKSERLRILGENPLLTHNSIIVTEVKKQMDRWYQRKINQVTSY